jgi:hypothetical protein
MTVKKVVKMVGAIVFWGLIGCGGGGGGGYDDESDFRMEPLEGGKTMKISKYVGGKQFVRIPSSIQGKPITIIGEKAFHAEEEFEGFSVAEKAKIISVTIPNGVTTIEKGAFAGNQLTDVIIPNGVITIGERAFAENRLNSVTIGRNVAEIGDSAFTNNQLASVVIPNNVITIGEMAFAENRLTNVSIGNSVTTIGEGAFAGSALEERIDGDSVATSEDGNRITSLTIGKNVITIGEWAFAGNQLASITIPNNVTTIEDGAFAVNQLVSVTIGKNVATIGGGAFFYNQLTNITIPSGVTTIGLGAFAKNHLSSLSIASSNTSYSAKDLFLLSKDGKTLIDYYGNEKDVIVPNSVTTIGITAFFENQLTSVTIPNNVTNIEEMAFASNQLTSVTIPNSVTTIGGYAFMDNQLTDVIIPNNVITIDSFAFANNQLTNITIPHSVKTIGNGAFFENQLTSVTIGANVELGNVFFESNWRGDSFNNAYRSANRAAGIYTHSNRRWSRANIPNLSSDTTANDGAIQQSQVSQQREVKAASSGGNEAQTNGQGSGFGDGGLDLKKGGELKMVTPDFKESVTVTGGRSKASINRVVMQNMAALRHAYNRRLRDKPGLNGRITVKFAIDEFGRVIFAQMVESTINDSELEGIVVDRVRSWNFDKIDKSGDVTEVTYPFMFSQ